jgi:hypothetical protein
MENTEKMTSNADSYPRLALPTGTVFHHDAFGAWLLHYATRLQELKQNHSDAEAR